MINKIFVFTVYNFLKILTLTYQKIYFPITKVINKKGLNIKGAGIFVSNHPNTLLDPLNVFSRTSRQPSFLANAGMFNHPAANWFFNQFGIPIYRKGKDEGARKIDNKQSFVRAYDHLAKGGVIFIAPEGSSDMERHLRPIKTGTARIVLEAESQNEFKLNTFILPVGLNYEHPNQCGSRILIKVGEPILVSKWENDYHQNPKEAARKLTEELETQMQALIIHTDGKEQDQLLYRLESVLQNDEPLGVEEHHNRTQNLLKGLQSLKQENVSKYEELNKNTGHYRHQLNANNLTDRGISARSTSLFTFISILGWPFWLYGRINNWLAIEIPRWLVGKLDFYIGYSSTVKILSGLFTFPTSYFLQYKLVKFLLGAHIAWYYLLSLPISLFIHWAYQAYITPKIDGWKWRRWHKKEKNKAELLLNTRQELKEKSLSLILKSR